MTGHSGINGIMFVAFPIIVICVCASAFIGGRWIYGAGWDHGRVDLINNPTRESYTTMGYGVDVNEKPDHFENNGTSACWKHLDGNGTGCRPNPKWRNLQ